jgi:hypothetical protein
LDEVLESIEDFFNNEYGKKGIELRKLVREQHGGSKVAGLKFHYSEKNIDFEINFVTYRH